MKNNRLAIALLFGAALDWSHAVSMGSPQDDNTVKKDAQKAGNATKDAAKDTGQATKNGTNKA